MNMNIKYVNGKKMITNEKNKLDQYFTKQNVSKYLNQKVKEIISKYDDVEDYLWIEPSVGKGAFFDLMPKNKRIGVDIKSEREDVLELNYLDFELPNKKIIVMGNPPFGHRGVLALEFINHSIRAEYVCFILPMFFESKGKGSIKYRVKGFNLIYSKKLESKAFYTLNGKDVDVKCVFQIWSKNHKDKDKSDLSWYSLKNHNPFKKYIDVFTVSTAKKRECGKKWIFEERADYYLASTFYKNTKVVYDFKDVKYGSGLAIKINTREESEIKKIKKIFEKANWEEYSSLATNTCRHIGKIHIYELMRDNGFEGQFKE